MLTLHQQPALYHEVKRAKLAKTIDCATDEILQVVIGLLLLVLQAGEINRVNCMPR